MFDVEYYGGNSVAIATKEAKLWIDANREVFGLTSPKNLSGIMLATEERLQPKDRDGLVSLIGPGEYEVGPFWIQGIPATRLLDSGSTRTETTIYRITIGEIRMAVFGNVQDNLTDEQLEEIGMIDIAVVPIGGGGYTLDASAVHHIISQVSPSVVIPVHYAGSGLQYEVPQDSLDSFVASMNVSVEQVPKLRIKNASSLPNTLTVYQLERQ